MWYKNQVRRCRYSRSVRVCSFSEYVKTTPFFKTDKAQRERKTKSWLLSSLWQLSSPSPQIKSYELWCTIVIIFSVSLSRIWHVCLVWLAPKKQGGKDNSRYKGWGKCQDRSAVGRVGNPCKELQWYAVSISSHAFAFLSHHNVLSAQFLCGKLPRPLPPHFFWVRSLATWDSSNRLDIWKLH
jgi:hypothetical protein